MVRERGLPQMPMITNDQRNCNCAICKNEMDFDLPLELIEAVRERNLVLFAGAGISTETRTVFPSTFYSEIKDELNCDENLPFPEVMSRFCEKNGRAKLIQLVKKRLDYVRSFPEIRIAASRFHRELASIHQITEIITTNWDDLFEEFCGATPIVTAKDMVFWSNPGRKVLKIHGSVTNWGSIVATKEDYLRCHEELTSGVLGGLLKTILATKSVVFIGYSFGDEDFNQIYDALIGEMADLMPHAYIVTIDNEAVEKFKNMNLTPILTDGRFFISSLKKHLIEEGVILPDERLDHIPVMHECVYRHHQDVVSKFRTEDNPSIVYCLCYQDGLLHAFERMIAMKRTGEYSDPARLHGLLHTYDKHLKRECLERGIYHDVAYIEGYENGLAYLLMNDDEREALPPFFAMGYEGEIRTLEEFADISQKAKELNTDAYEYALELTRKMDGTDLTFHHTPFL